MSKSKISSWVFRAGTPVEVVPTEKRHRSEAAWELAIYEEPASFPSGHHWVRSTLRGRFSVPGKRIRGAVMCLCGHASAEHRLPGVACSASGCGCEALVVRMTDPAVRTLTSDLSEALDCADDVETSTDRGNRVRLALCTRALVAEVRIRARLMGEMEAILADEVIRLSRVGDPIAAAGLAAKIVKIQEAAERLPVRASEMYAPDGHDRPDRAAHDDARARFRKRGAM